MSRTNNFYTRISTSFPDVLVYKIDSVAKKIGLSRTDLMIILLANCINEFEEKIEKMESEKVKVC